MSYDERKIQTLRALNTLYDWLKGIVNEGHFVYSNSLANKLGLDEQIFMDMAYYLQGKGLVKVGPKVRGPDFNIISITKEGVAEVEAARECKESSVEKYPPGIINRVIIQGNMMGSAIIQNSSNVSNVQSSINTITSDLERITQFAKLLKEEYKNYNLTAEQKAEIEADISSMESQIKSPRPKLSILKEIGRNAWEIVKPLVSETIKEIAMPLFT